MELLNFSQGEKHNITSRIPLENNNVGSIVYRWLLVSNSEFFYSSATINYNVVCLCTLYYVNIRTANDY